jgi:acyl carrier protein
VDFPENEICEAFRLKGRERHRTVFPHMEVTKKNSPTPTELIDWLNDEGVLELDWDFPEDGNLAGAGLDSAAVVQLIAAVEDRYGIELGPEDLTVEHLATPTSLAARITELLP